jgi:aminoglycoside phosphotransferase (APT) family kinase protein
MATVEPHDFGKEVKAIARASEHLEVLRPATRASITSILDRATELYSRLPQETPTFAHGDLKADHLFVTRKGLTLIDFDTCYLADPAIDVGKFLADLRWWYSKYRLPHVEHAQQQFLNGYFGRENGARLLRARVFEALILTKITVRRVRLFERDWAYRTEQLVQTASAIVDRAFSASPHTKSANRRGE